MLLMRVALDLTKDIRAGKGSILDRKVTILGDAAAILVCGATILAVLGCGATILAVLGGAATILAVLGSVAAVLAGGATVQAVLRGAATILADLGDAAAILAGGGIETHFRSSGEHVTMKYFHLANHYPGTGCGGEGFGLET